MSCQIEDKNAPAPDDSFIKYYGELTNYEASDIEIIYDATGEIPEGFIVFGTKTTTRGDDDYFIMRTDLQGVLLDSVSIGLSDTLDIDDDGVGDDWTGDGVIDRFQGDEIAGQIQRIPGLGYGIIGSSSINISALGISEWKWLSFGFVDDNLEPITILGDTLLFDFALGDNGEFLDIEGNDIIQLEVGDGILLVGGREFGGGGLIDFDFFMRKINLQEGEIFDLRRGITGIDEDDILSRAFEKPNGNLVMIGSSNTPSSRGENAGDNGTNVFYLETDPNGTPTRSAAYGFEDPDNNIVFNEEVANVIRTSFGFTVVGTSNTSQNQKFAYVMNLSENGVYLSGNNHDSSAFNTEANTLQTIGKGVVQTAGNNLILLGQYPSFTTTGVASRGAEGMFVQFDQAANPIEGTEAYFGLSDGNDDIVDAVVLPDGKIVAVSNVDFGGGVQLISIMKLNDTGELEN